MKKFLFATAAALTLAACSSPNGNQWDNYGSDKLSTANLNDSQALAVFYRTEAFEGPAVNIYVNGDYQVSLLEKGYSPVVMCANNSLVTTSFVSNKEFGNRTQGANYDLTAKEISFFRAIKNAVGNPDFEPVDEETARAELKQLKGKVINTAPRTTKVCK